jgi:hypothetical protein
MTSFRKRISNTLSISYSGLSHKVVQYYQIPLRYVQVICVVDVFGDALIEFDSWHRPHHIKIGGLPLTITPNDTSRRWTYSFRCILQERFYPYSLAALGTPSYDTCERMLHNTGPIDNNTGLRWSVQLYFGDVNGYLKLRMICYKLCKNETCSLICDKTPNEIIFKMVDYL